MDNSLLRTVRGRVLVDKADRKGSQTMDDQTIADSIGAGSLNIDGGHSIIEKNGF